MQYFVSLIWIAIFKFKEFCAFEAFHFSLSYFLFLAFIFYSAPFFALQTECDAKLAANGKGN